MYPDRVDVTEGSARIITTATKVSGRLLRKHRQALDIPISRVANDGGITVPDLSHSETAEPPKGNVLLRPIETLEIPINFAEAIDTGDLPARISRSMRVLDVSRIGALSPISVAPLPGVMARTLSQTGSKIAWL